MLGVLVLPSGGFGDGGGDDDDGVISLSLIHVPPHNDDDNANAGKTVAGELAIYYALALGLRVFYTTPLKVLF